MSEDITALLPESGAWERTEQLATRFADGARRGDGEDGAPWHVVQLGCRAEYRFSPTPPRNGGEAAALGNEQLERFLHLYALNRGVLITPFHNMALMCGETKPEQVERHTEVFDGALRALFDS
jgi:glutamate-1-semialdehyde 2,1-aminomutase